MRAALRKGAETMTDYYGDIELPEMTQGLLEATRATAAKLEAEEIATARGDEIDTDNEAEAIAYIEQWYYWDRAARRWRPR